MKRLVLALIFSLSATAVQAEVICNSKSAKTNLRIGPSAKNYDIAATLKNGDEISVLERVTNPDGYDYLKVEFVNPSSGNRDKAFVYHEAVANNCSSTNKTSTLYSQQKSPKVRLIEIPNSMAVKSEQGCKLFNPSPLIGDLETVKWTGACINGYAWGDGELTWLKNGKINGSTKKTRLYNGFSLVPAVAGSSFIGAGLSYKDKRGKSCIFVLPIYGIKKHKKHWSFRYDGLCPTGSISRQTREKASAVIFFKGQRFAKFNGVVLGGVYPVEGTLKFFSGAEFIFSDNIDLGKYSSIGDTRDWTDNIKVRPGIIPGQKNSSIDKNLFKIQLDFGAEPNSAENVVDDFLIFSTKSVRSSADLNLRYRVSASEIIRNKNYKLDFRITLKILEKTSLGWASQTDHRYFNKNISVELNSSNSYSDSGKVKLSTLETYFSNIVTNEVVGIEPTATIVAIREAE